MEKLVLHTYWRSSASHRVRLALGYKGLTYEPAFVNLIEGQQKTEEHRAKNPLGFVPCLEMGGSFFVESVAILELIEELHPEPPLLPKDPHDRARIRALVQYINAGIEPLQNLVVLDKVGDDKERRMDWLRYFISRGLGAFDALVARFEEERGLSGPFSFGSTFSMADALLLPQCYAARRYGVDVESLPRVARIEAACRDLPFVKKAYPDAQPDAKP